MILTRITLVDFIGKIRLYVQLAMLNAVNVFCAMQKADVLMIADTSVKLWNQRWMMILVNHGNHGSIEASAIRTYPNR